VDRWRNNLLGVMVERKREGKAADAERKGKETLFKIVIPREM
jgi:hypothetical protein